MLYQANSREEVNYLFPKRLRFLRSRELNEIVRQRLPRKPSPTGLVSSEPSRSVFCVKDSRAYPFSCCSLFPEGEQFSLKRGYRFLFNRISFLNFLYHSHFTFNATGQYCFVVIFLKFVYLYFFLRINLLTKKMVSYLELTLIFLLVMIQWNNNKVLPEYNHSRY